MNITILTNNDLASVIALNQLLPQLEAHQISIFKTAKVGGSNTLPWALQQLAFVEQHLFSQLLFPLLEKSQTSAAILPFSQLAKQYNCEVEQIKKINQPNQIETIRAQKPDLILSIRFGEILRDDVISIPKFGVLNLHSGLLPQYQGVMPTFRAMSNGDKFIGTTLHYISDSGIDTGDILATSLVPVEYEKSYLWNVLQLYPCGVKAMAEAVKTLEHDRSLKSEEQTGERAYFTFPTEQELQAFSAKGCVLFDGSEIVEIAEGFL